MNLSLFADHLWQSTLFAAVAGLLTLALRNNRARVRHGLWLAASYKFLIPISWLIALGGHIEWRKAQAIRPSNVSVVMEQVSQPFTAPAVSSPPLITAPPGASPLPAILLGIWGCGFIGITGSWWVRWRRIRTAVRAGSPMDIDLPIRAMCSPTLFEPGIFGIFRPVLLLPADVAAHLTPAQLKAVIAHELCHVRHRDNLAAAIHMFVETVFWFHPLVWWIGKRMVEERERACDQEVLRDFGEPKVYAEGILNVCKLYVESQLACVSGVSGVGNLKKRIEAIMNNQTALRLSFTRKAVLAGASIAAFAVPIGVGILNAPSLRAQSPDVPEWQTAAGGKMAFEVASVKPSKVFKVPNFDLSTGNSVAPGGRLSAGWSLGIYITFAYKLQQTDEQRSAMLAVLPKWANTDYFEIEARAAGNATKDQMRLMMQSLLADRFKLAVHFETREVPVLALTLDKPDKFGPKLRPHSEGPACPEFKGFDPASGPERLKAVDAFPPQCDTTLLYGERDGPLKLGSRNATMQLLAETLQANGSMAGEIDKPVVDRTGLSGTFDYTVEYSRGGPGPGGTRLSPPGDDTSPPPETTFLQAVRQQLGLKLVPSRAPIRTIVIDHVERPTEN